MRRMLLLLLLVSVAGCDFGLTDLESIANDPFSYQGRTLTVTGIVSWSGYLPDVGHRAFELEQGSARLLVLSRKDSPEPGTKIKVVGCLEASFDLGDRRAPALIDEDPGPKLNGGASDVR